MPVRENGITKNSFSALAGVVSGFTMGNEFNGLSKTAIMCGTQFHSYIHSFRFAQAQNVMKMVAQAYFFFIILLVGNSVYYKSRGDEWAVRLAG